MALNLLRSSHFLKWDNLSCVHFWNSFFTNTFSCLFAFTKISLTSWNLAPFKCNFIFGKRTKIRSLRDLANFMVVVAGECYNCPKTAAQTMATNGFSTVWWSIFLPSKKNAVIYALCVTHFKVNLSITASVGILLLSCHGNRRDSFWWHLIYKITLWWSFW